MTDKESKHTLKCAWKSFEGTFCPEAERLLKAQKKECEELKIYIESNEQQVKEVETLVMDNDRLITELDQLETENEKLKEEVAKTRMEICNQCGERDDYNIPCKQIRDLDYGLQLKIKEKEKLKQALIEIRKCLTKNAEKGWVSTSEIDDILQNVGC